jgi:nitrite reductase/ring-hydroxylating ferredoxin subunit
MTGRGLRRYLDDLLAGRRPRPFRATQADAEELRLALELRAARPDADAPREGFVDELHRRLAAELEPAGPEPAAPEPAAPEPAPEPVRPPVPLFGRRRLLLQGAGLAAASAAVGAGVGVAVDRGVRAGAPESGTLTPAAGAWQTVAASTELPEGAVRAFDLGTVAGFVHRADGAVRAVSGSCTHQGCRLRLDAARNLDCPCHTTVFAPSGELITHQLPIAPRPLPQFATREVDGAVQVYGPQV